MPKSIHTIMVVDDDEDILALAADYLREHCFHVVEARNAMEALSLLTGGTEVDLLFTDILMPGGIDGFALAHQARQHRPSLRVLYTSGYLKDLPHPGSSASEGRLLPKPWRLVDLLSEIHRALA